MTCEDGEQISLYPAAYFIRFSRISTKRPIFIQPPPGSAYPAIKEPADVTTGQSNVVPYTFYLPAVEPLNTAINPSAPTDVTNAKVPNLKMTIPQGMRLRVLGSSADVTHVSITPVPLPSTVAPAMVYSSQPGNACIVDSSNQCMAAAEYRSSIRT